MTYILIIAGYSLLLFLFCRFLQAIHNWDDEIEEMEKEIPKPKGERK